MYRSRSQCQKQALKLHDLPAAAQPTVEVMCTTIDLFRQDGLSDSVTFRRENESLRQHRQRVRCACTAYIFQAVLSDTWTNGQRQTISDFWHAIMTNQIGEIDRANIARYEDAVVNAQRQRTAAITPKVIKLGVCVAQAWKRSRSIVY